MAWEECKKRMQGNKNKQLQEEAELLKWVNYSEFTWSKVTKPANSYILIQTITTAMKWTTKFFGTLLSAFILFIQNSNTMNV